MLSSLLVAVALVVLAVALGVVADQSGKPQPGFSDLIKADRRVRVVGETSGRLWLIVPTDLIQIHSETLAKVRGKAPKEVTLLSDSTQQTQGSVYPVCVYCEVDKDGMLVYYLLDGHQRFRAAKANHEAEISAIYLTRWSNVDMALRDATSLLWARYEAQDDDVFSLLDTGKLTIAEVAKHTGKDEDTVRRFDTIRAHLWLREGIAAKILGYSVAAKLIKACESNPDKLAALTNTFIARHEAATTAAKQFEMQTANAKGKKIDRKLAKRKHLNYYFGTGENWNAWTAAIEDGSLTTRSDGKKLLKIAEATKTSAVIIGGTSDWDKEIAVYGLFGQSVDAVDAAGIQCFLDEWPNIEKKMRTILERKIEAESRARHPMPSSNPTTTEDIEDSPKPVEQVDQPKPDDRPKLDDQKPDDQKKPDDQRKQPKPGRPGGRRRRPESSTEE